MIGDDYDVYNNHGFYGNEHCRSTDVRESNDGCPFDEFQSMHELQSMHLGDSKSNHFEQ